MAALLRPVHLKDSYDVMLQRHARAAQAQLQAADLCDATFQLFHGVGVLQERAGGLSIQQFASDLQ